MEIKLEKLLKELEQSADPEKAKNLRWFFKTGKGSMEKEIAF